jgi:hypothetical protein
MQLFMLAALTSCTVLALRAASEGTYCNCLPPPLLLLLLLLLLAAAAARCLSAAPCTQQVAQCTCCSLVL